MIDGLGIDIVEIERVTAKISKENGFREKVFSPSEISFCEATSKNGEHYAARFAAKEAFLKATGQGLGLGFDLHLIEVAHDRNGKPHLKLSGSFHDHAIRSGWKQIHLSISHSETTACAVVIIES